MRTNRREFLQTSALASLAAAHSTSVASDGRTAGISTDAHLNAFEIARRHMIVRDTPSPSFFDGMLLGNGDVGACVVVRPDAVGIHIGKNDCWDIRVSEDITNHVLPFCEVLQLWQRASEEAKKMGKPDMLYLETGVPFFREYSERVGSSYDKKKWPRPWPCGTIWINWDPTWVEPSQHTLDLANGLFTLRLRRTDVENENSRVQLFIFVDWETGLISALTDQALPLRSIVYSPEIDGSHIGPFESGKSKEAFELHLRAVGAFLVSATHDGDKVTHLSLHSEKGSTAKLASPWAGKGMRIIRSSDHGEVQARVKGDIVSFDTRADETYLIAPA